jgi:hypothetical protein
MLSLNKTRRINVPTYIDADALKEALNQQLTEVQTNTVQRQALGVGDLNIVKDMAEALRSTIRAIDNLLAQQADGGA